MPPVLRAPTAPTFGALGLGPNEDPGARVDMPNGPFAGQIEFKGQRLVWSRAARCPCAPINAQSDQPDPNCALCDGAGWSYFGPTQGQSLAAEMLSEVQRLLVTQIGGFVIKGLLIGVNKMDLPWDKIGSWRSGSASVTVRSVNRLGFMDRLVNLDAEISFTEVVEMPQAPTTPLPSRYLVSGGVYLVRSVSRRFTPGTDYTVQKGRIVFTETSAPAPKTRLALHYVTYPTWVVQDIPNVSRLTNLSDGALAISPDGDPHELPLRATVRLDFLGPLSEGEEGRP